MAAGETASTLSALGPRAFAAVLPAPMTAGAHDCRLTLTLTLTFITKVAEGTTVF